MTTRYPSAAKSLSRNRRPSPPSVLRRAPKKPSELVEFEALQKRVEDLRNIAIINPSEHNIRNYLNIQNFVIEKASTFADVAQRVIWATPELDPTVTGRPVNAKALEVFDREQALARTNTVARLSQTHALFFFFRSDCPYCHQFAPLLRDFEAKFGLHIVPISVDGGGLPEFRSPKGRQRYRPYPRRPPSARPVPCRTPGREDHAHRLRGALRERAPRTNPGRHPTRRGQAGAVHDTVRPRHFAPLGGCHAASPTPAQDVSPRDPLWRSCWPQ